MSKKMITSQNDTLVGGFNPSDFFFQVGSSPQVTVKIKKIFGTSTLYLTTSQWYTAQ